MRVPIIAVIVAVADGFAGVSWSGAPVLLLGLDPLLWPAAVAKVSQLSPTAAALSAAVVAVVCRLRGSRCEVGEFVPAAADN